MPQIGFPELLIIGIVVVLLFGTSKIPEFAKGLGTGIKNFKSALKSETAEMKAHVDDLKHEVEKG